jgi:type II secretory pathway component PulF
VSGNTVFVSDEDTQQARAAEADTGIKLGRLKRTGDTKSATVATFDEADIKKIQMSVQTLVQAASPIGKCMDYVQEDLRKSKAEHRRIAMCMRLCLHDRDDE